MNVTTAPNTGNRAFQSCGKAGKSSGTTYTHGTSYSCTEPAILCLTLVPFLPPHHFRLMMLTAFFF